MIGNKADVSSNDLLEWWEDDEDTDLVLLYVQSLPAFTSSSIILARVARLVFSRSRAGRPHLASAPRARIPQRSQSSGAVDALFHQAGVIRAGSLEELIDVATTPLDPPRASRPRVAVLTNAGGLGIAIADACDAAGLLPELGDETVDPLPRVLPVEASTANPVDMLGSTTATTY